MVLCIQIQTECWNGQRVLLTPLWSHKYHIILKYHFKCNSEDLVFNYTDYIIMLGVINLCFSHKQAKCTYCPYLLFFNVELTVVQLYSVYKGHVGINIWVSCVLKHSTQPIEIHCGGVVLCSGYTRPFFDTQGSLLDYQPYANQMCLHSVVK